MVTNRLAREQSPYLLQHQDNPVEWYPWGEDAFRRAREDDKPIFLSIGYSTCHWCHVMAHESFENADVAALLNRDFVSIKVDREERPDVDRVYMTFVQATTGSGGWPMSVWLTPQLQPFYGGTYFPPTSRWGRPGFIEVLTEIARVWREERDKVEQSAASIVERLRSLGDARQATAIPGPAVLDTAVRDFVASADRRRGGFGGAPKFPRPSELLFLLREHARTGADEPLDVVLLTLRGMALGGMRDHIGGGFHRYSVDANWRVPHFEKMLYDQAQLVLAYLEAAQVTADVRYADIAADTLQYVQRDLSDPAGGFYSAEDADSVPPESAGAAHPHKVEGAFYVWTAEELRDVLGETYELFAEHYGVRPDGNAPEDPQGEFTGKNLLYTARNLDELAQARGVTVEEVGHLLRDARRRLFERRAGRPRPHLDDKVLTAWNGLMIAAFARAGRVLAGDPRFDADGYLASARRAATFVRERLWDARRGRLLRRYRQGDAAVDAYAEDYAYLIFGLLELFQADGDAAWLAWARTLQAQQDALFWDAAGGGWFSTTGDDPSVLLRLKEDYDGAEPAASSIGVLNLLLLSHLTSSTDASRHDTAQPAPRAAGMDEQIALTLRLFGGRAAQTGRTVPMALAALSTYHAGLPQVVLAADAQRDLGPLQEVLRRRYLPTAVVISVVEGQRAELDEQLPWIRAMRPRDGAATAFVCREFSCLAPTSSPEGFAAQLDELEGRRS